MEIVEATTRGEVEGKLYARGWLKINGLKVREAKNEPSTDNNMD